jgi:hypothetical protein
VIGYNGENGIKATGPTQAGAWQLACYQARPLGMLGRARVTADSRKGGTLALAAATPLTPSQ